MFNLEGHLMPKEEHQKQIHDMALQIADCYDICNPTDLYDFLTQSELEDCLTMLSRFSGVVTFDIRKSSAEPTDTDPVCTTEYYYIMEKLIRLLYFNPDMYDIESYGGFLYSMNVERKLLSCYLNCGKPEDIDEIFVDFWNGAPLSTKILIHCKDTIIHLTEDTFNSIQELIYRRLTPFQYQFPWQKPGNPNYKKVDCQLHLCNRETEERINMPYILGFKELLRVVDFGEEKTNE